MTTGLSEAAITITKFLRESRPLRPVLIVGSGASIDSGLKGWDDLKLELQAALRKSGAQPIEDVLQLADQAKMVLGNEEYCTILRKSFRDPLAEPGELYEILGSLRDYCSFVATPNFDVRHGALGMGHMGRLGFSH